MADKCDCVKEPVSPEPPRIDNGAHGIDELMFNTEVSEDFVCIVN